MSGPIVLVCPSFAHSRGVLDYTGRLAEELQRQGHDVVFVSRFDPGLPGVDCRVYSDWSAAAAWSIAADVARLRPALTILQYVPYLYARRGVSWSPVVLAWRLRRLGMPAGVMVHEAYVPLFESAPRFVAGVLQRLMLLGVAACATWLAASTEPLAHRLSRWCRVLGQPVAHVPVGGNIPPAGAQPAPPKPLLLFFGSGHASKRLDWALAAAASLGTRLVVIGMDGAAVAKMAPGELARWAKPLGYCEPSQVSRYLAAADLLLLPFEGGVSTRRTTVISGLQHGTPVVTTVGPETDAWLAKAEGLALTPAGDRDAFVRKVEALWADPIERRRLGRAGRELYDREFAWPIIARRFLFLGNGTLQERAA